MSIFFFQLSSLVRKNVVVFNRIFFVELLFTKWVALSFFFLYYYFFLYKVCMTVLSAAIYLQLFLKLNFFFFL